MTQQETNTTEKKAPALIAYHVPARDEAPWTRIGAAWDHKDGKGLTLQLDLVPVVAAASSCASRTPKKARKQRGRARERPPSLPSAGICR